MLRALRDAGLAGGRVKFVGFDAGDTLLAGLRAGDIQGLVIQDPFSMGYLGVKAVVAAIRGEAVPRTIRTRIGLVTPENLNDPAIVALLHPL
jgi:ribose transport system substrate-binding protein